MDTMNLLIGFFVLCGAGVLLAAVVPQSRQSTLLAGVGGLASITQIVLGAGVLLDGSHWRLSLWRLPDLGNLSIGLDPLGGAFILISGMVLLPGCLFAANQMQRFPQPYSQRGFTILCLALLASVTAVVVAADGLSLLMAWETMSILSYLLVQFEHERDEHTRSGYVLLAMGEAGTLALVAAFALLAVTASGSVDFQAIKNTAGGLGSGMYWAVFALAFFGFGVKAGLLPVNFWLPRAYTAAPAAFTPILAGATLNLGLYGICRVHLDLLPALQMGPGLLVLVIGSVSALVGILYATTANDLKTILAHSSIENAGIITAGLGAALVFKAAGLPVLAAMALLAALYHLFNHSLYKTLLFCGAGTLEAQTGTRDLDRLGGMIKVLPWTAALFLIATLAIAGLPPLNGFVSEWLTLQSLLRAAELDTTGAKLVFALSGAALALTIALAVTCFVKVFAMGFLGMRRLPAEQPVREAGRGALAPMVLLAGACIVFGLAPSYIIPILDGAVRPLTQASASEALVPPFFSTAQPNPSLTPEFVSEFHDLGAQLGSRQLPGRGLVVLHRGGADNPVVFAMSTSYSALALMVLLGLTWLLVHLPTARRRRLSRQTRWDGGVRRLLPEMTYTATGFSNPVRVVFDAVFRPTTVEDSRESIAEHFRTAIRRERVRVYVLDRLLLQPVVRGALLVSAWLARMHHGRINAYIAYVLLSLVVVLMLALR